MITKKDIHNSKIFLIENWEHWPFNTKLAGTLHSYGPYTHSLLEVLLLHDDKIEDTENKDIIHFVFNDDFFLFQDKVYFKNEQGIWNLNKVPYDKLVCYGIKYHLLQGYGEYSHTWTKIFFYLLSTRFSYNVEFMLKKKNFFEKWKNTILDGFIFSFDILKFRLQISTFSKLTSAQKQNLIGILLYLKIDKNKAENLISNLVTKDNVSEITQYLKQVQLSYKE